MNGFSYMPRGWRCLLSFLAGLVWGFAAQVTEQMEDKTDELWETQNKEGMQWCIVHGQNPQSTVLGDM